MKKLIYLFIFFLLLHSQNTHSQQVMIDANTVIKDEEGHKIDTMKFMSLMQSGEWLFDQKKDEAGNDFIQLRKATEQEKAEFQQVKSPPKSSSAAIGTKAPDFEVTDLNGKTYTSKNTKGKIVVLNFWFAKCKPCIMEIPELNEVYEKYKTNKNIVFISVTFDSEDIAKSFLKKYTFKYPVVANNMGLINDFGTGSYPTNIIIDRDGNYADIISGGFPHIGKTIESNIEKALH